MSRGISSEKTFRHGSVSVVLTVLVVAVAMILNAIFSTLAMRFRWFVDMNPSLLYPVTDTCYDYIDTYVIPEAEKSGQKIRLIFCDEEDNLRESDTQKFILHTAEEMKQHYPDLLDMEFLNVWENPSRARSYGVKASTAVVVECGDKHVVCNLPDFFVFSADDAATPVAYGGEKRLAVAMKAVISDKNPMAYFTLNHGESFPDYALMSAITDAGYFVNYLDAVSFDIPADCELLVTYNPIRDFTDVDGVSGISEIDKLDAYLNRGGKMMVFASADTFAAGRYNHLEDLLSEWGVAFTHKKGAGGMEECFAIRDKAHALTTDGYTFLGRLPASGTGTDLMSGIDGTIRVANATGLSPAKDFTPDADGNFRSPDGNRLVTPLLLSHAGAEAWVGGRAVERTDSGYPLVTLSRDSGSGGCLFVSSSIDLASEDSLQSGVFDNHALLMKAFGAMGKTDTPVGLITQPFSDDTIRTLTTANARTITIVLTALPACAALVVGLIVLIRRKFA